MRAALFFLLACSSPPAAGPDGTEKAANSATPTSPSPWDPDLQVADPAPPLTVEQLQEGLAEGLDYLARLDPSLHHDIWYDVFLANVEDGICPEITLHNGMDHWNADCWSSDGAHFNGWNLRFRRGGWREGDLDILDYAWLTGHSFIEDPSGERVENFGDMELQVARTTAGSLRVDGFVFGDFSWTGDEATGTYLQEETSNETYFWFEDRGDWQSARYEAAINWLNGPAIALRLENVAISEAPGSCPLEPTGTIRLRDREGRWYDIVYGSSPEELCDGCGILTDETGESEFCADFSSLVDWEGWPWTR
jgi:hypothetical protein